jgi:hypothetical protein
VEDFGKPVCLMLAPFQGPWSRVFHPVVELLERRGVKATWVGAKLDAASGVMSRLQQSVAEADLIIVDVSEDSSSSMYGLGYVHALRKPTQVTISHSSQNPTYLKWPIRGGL